MQRVPSVSAERSSRARIRLLVACPVRLFRDGLASTLRKFRRFVVATAASANDSLAVILRQPPDVILLDMTLAEGRAILELVAREKLATKVVALGIADVDTEVIACAEAGLAGYVVRDDTIDRVVTVIEDVHRGELACSPRVAAAAFRRLASLARRIETAPAADLTIRERQVLELIEEGLSNKQIASRLHVAVSTVKNHVHHILEKRGVRRRAQAASGRRRERMVPAPAAGAVDERAAGA